MNEIKETVSRSRLTAALLGVGFSVLMLSVNNVSADVLFQDNFDGGAPYSDNGALPTGFGIVSHGLWYSSIADTGGQVTTVTSPNLSPGRSLFIQGGIAEAGFGPDGNHIATTTDALDFTFAFRTAYQGAAFASVQDAAFNNLAEFSMGYAGPYIGAYFGDRGWVTNAATFNIDQWYYGEVIMPANPSPTSQYTVKVFDSAHVLIDSETGTFAQAATVGDSYKYIEFYEPYAASQGYAYSINIDNVLVTGIPEPASLGLTAVGGVLLWRRQKK